MRAALAFALVALTLLPGLAQAQTQVNPVVGKFETIYAIAGRVMDKDSHPVVNASVAATLSDEGATGTVRGFTNCNGDFFVYFSISEVHATGRITVVIDTRGIGGGNLTQTVPIDPFYRRTDLRFQLPASWDRACPDSQQFPSWGRVSLTGRIVSRVDPPALVGAVPYDAKAYGPAIGGLVLRYATPDGKEYCPPGAGGPNSCERLDVDERGDFKYTFTFPTEISANGTMRLTIANHTFNVTVDPLTRIAQAHLELTGKGSPVYATSKAPGFGLVPTAAVVVALAAGRRFLAKRRG